MNEARQPWLRSMIQNSVHSFKPLAAARQYFAKAHRNLRYPKKNNRRVGKDQYRTLYQPLMLTKL
jgi:hypothetical protein